MAVSLPFRVRAINSAINTLNGTSYVEIGVKAGSTFKYVQCRQKIGVDPVLTSWKLRLFLAMHRNCKFFNETSDDFFRLHASGSVGEIGIDVAFIDGLHSYAQTVIDVQNVLRFLNTNGLIFMHDCNPENELSAIPGASPEIVKEKSGGTLCAWNGDVWKTIVLLRSQPDLNVFVLNCDHGIGVVHRKSNQAPLSYTEADIETMSYADLEKNRVELLNLKDPEYLETFLKEYPPGQN